MTDEQAREFWTSDDARGAREQDEAYLVRQIRDVLLTEEQRHRLFEWDISVEDLLNGRVAGDDQDVKYAYFFDSWNARLGRREFGF